MSIPRPDDGLSDSERATIKFLNRYKIGKRAYELSPKISDILQRAIGNRQRVIETLKFSKDPSAQKLLEFCERLNWRTRGQIPIEALCLAAGVDITTIAGALVMSARDVSRLESSLITMREHPNIVEATARMGEAFAENSKDREMFHKAAGWLPTPKGSNISVNVFDPKHGVSAEDDDDDGSLDLESVFGSDPKEIENWGETRRSLLESGK